MYRILLIDEDPTLRESAAALSAEGHSVVAVDPSTAMGVMDNNEFDIVMAGVDRQTERTPQTTNVPPTVLYLARPFSTDDILSAVAAVEQGVTPPSRPSETLAPAIVGRSPAMRTALTRLSAVADSDAPVLLTGETGTGKDLFARAIHANSSRRGRPFVAVNCAAFPEALIEAELFGYERGAFTGALQRRDGRFKAADGGTLFLDEINGLSAGAQAKLLRVLQDGSFQPIGTNTTHTVNVRLVSATNRPLRDLVKERSFREDLYYRVKVLDVAVPPLRDRANDLPLLVHHFLAKHARSPIHATLTPRAWAALAKHDYPGNVRELEHVIHHAVVLSRGAPIDVTHLPADLFRSLDGARATSELRTLSDAVREFESEYVLRVLQATQGNRTRAAKVLGISRKNLWEKLAKATTASPPREDDADPRYRH